MARRTKRITPKEAGKALALVLTCVWLLFLVYGIFHKEKIARTTVKETKAELAAMQARKDTLAATVHGLDTERGQEASLRSTYGVAKPGEEVIIVVPKKELPPPPPPTFWSKLKGLFGF